jgi:hypothetical protein
VFADYSGSKKCGSEAMVNARRRGGTGARRGISAVITTGREMGKGFE